MQQYARIYLLQNHSLNISGVHCTRPDDGCNGHPQHAESDFAVNKYLRTVESCWILLI